MQRGGADVGAYILITVLAFWSVVAFSLNDMLLDATFDTATQLLDNDRERLSMIVTLFGLLLSFPYILTMALIDFIFRR